MSEILRVGPSGNGDAFYNAGNKFSYQAPLWLKQLGLNAYEYSFGRGFTSSLEMSSKIGEEAKINDILVSVHAPFFVNLANADDMMIAKSYGYILNSFEHLKNMNGKKIVVHVASQGKSSREEAFSRTETNLKNLLEILYDKGLNNYFLCPETMGKSMQIGTYKEIIDLCSIDKMLIPTFDFGHINCLMQGQLKTTNDYKRIFDYAGDKLDYFKVKNCHIHFSKIQYGPKGELKHLNYDDELYGPDFVPCAKYIIDNHLTPSIICESQSKMCEDALVYKAILDGIKSQN